MSAGAWLRARGFRNQRDGEAKGCSDAACCCSSFLSQGSQPDQPAGLAPHLPAKDGRQETRDAERVAIVALL
eukprot:883410-Pelagomonas_calceolata.AAC.5